jgi:hypothetical protein
MSEQPSGNLDNPSIQGRFKHYSRPTQYSKRTKPQLFTDVTDQFTHIYQAGIDDSQVPKVEQDKAETKPIGSPNLSLLYRKPKQQGVPVVSNNLNPIIPATLIPQNPPVQHINQQKNAPDSMSANSTIEYLSEDIFRQPDAQLKPKTRTDEHQEPQLGKSSPAVTSNQASVQLPIYVNNYGGEYEDSKPSRISRVRNVKLNKKRLIFSSSFAVTLVLVGLFTIFMSWSNNSSVAQAQSEATTNNQSSSNQSSQTTPASYASAIEPTQTQILNYNVAPTSPKYIIIPKLNVMSMINPISLDSSDNLSAPSNIFNTGWWQASSAPGQTGTTILDGFITNGVTRGVFSDLAKLSPNDTFQVELGSGTKVNYKVIKSTQFTFNGISMNQAISPLQANTPSLNIITCTGMTLTCPKSFGNDFVLFAQQV